MKLPTWLFIGLIARITLFSASGQGSDIAPPEPIYKVNPSHPDELFERGFEGRATVVATVDMFGSVKNPTIDMATHEEFGIAAMLAASEWIFEPATRNGVPIEVKVKLPFEFALTFEHRLNIEAGREVFRKIDATVLSSTDLEVAPTPKYVPAFSDFYPEHLKGSGDKASVTVDFIIGPGGNVHNPRVTTISDPAFRQSAIRAISHMRYNPIIHHGQPAYVSMKRPIQMSE